ncbi:MAG: hypothetical protein RLZZ385_1724 [Pseudomonadota bacterium]|jgi:rhamnose utilization protein RhaD (predicted bifunctional aldolase and dehydrogenase)/NAD(P)-dependent dehydrogenase (short-subunit alcohol dehydrogenase family)
MKNRWDDHTARSLVDPLELRVYSARLLGQEADLVMHGGGNCSVKGEYTDVFGDSVPALFVKGSGWDLASIEAAGFPATRLHHLQRLAELPSLTDSEMMGQLRVSLFDPGAPTPSVEALLHAIIPHRFVDHSHADAVVAMSNSPRGLQALPQLLGDDVLILPYVMPGFTLARQVAEATRGVDWQSLRGIVLLHHGVFTFADDARRSYDTMIELVSRAEDWLKQQGALAGEATASYSPAQADLLRLASLRRAAATALAAPLLVHWDLSPPAVGFAQLSAAGDLLSRGPLTPDHALHTKPFGACFDSDPLPGLITFQTGYAHYFQHHGQAHHQALDPVPRFGVWRDRGMLYLAPAVPRLSVIRDICRHTLRAIQWGEALGGWRPLTHAQIFEVEYWELEQAKLKTGQRPPALQGKVAVVTGAASGIGKASVLALAAQGCAVLALDIAPTVLQAFAGQTAVLPVQCDVTDREAVVAALGQAVMGFGGIDILVSNAGSFPPSVALADMTDDIWDASMAVNLDSHMKLLRAAIPFLRLGLDPAVVIIGSKNVPAPGPGAGAYSTAKAALTQLARVAALELGVDGIRVNVLHPNAVFDTAIWTEAVLQERASRYGMSVEEYRRNTLLGTEVTSADVAHMVCLFAGTETLKTTGAQIPVDGGNERVI